MNKRLNVLAAMAVSALTASLLLVVGPASAQTGCLSDIGSKIPVLFVHGFKVDRDIWGSPDDQQSMRGAIAHLSGVRTGVFNYFKYSLRWVTDPHIGAALATRIDCMAESSRQQGGKGKVVVVAHSMGGLAMKEAIKENPRVTSELGLVVTIATPNDGSDFDRNAFNLALSLCNLSATQGLVGQCSAMLQALAKVVTAIPGLQAGSSELQALPDWPRTVPVYAIAGNIRPHYNLFGLQFDGSPSGTDTLVITSSALHSVVTHGLGGIKEVLCTGGPPPVLPGWTHADCEHGALVSNSDVLDAVVQEIQQYVEQTSTVQIPRKYVGTWTTHAGIADIYPNGTGRMMWDAGQCSQHNDCQGNADISFQTTTGGIVGTITNVWYTFPFGNISPSEPPPGYQPPPGPQAGDSFELRFVQAGKLYGAWLGRASFLNHGQHDWVQ